MFDAFGQAGKSAVKFGHLDRKRSRAALGAKEADSEPGSDAERIDGLKDMSRRMPCTVACRSFSPLSTTRTRC